VQISGELDDMCSMNHRLPGIARHPND
jgi:hypothetical protein